MKRLALILALATAMPTYAGGPVVVEDDTNTIAPADPAKWVVPVIVGAMILCAIACGEDDDPAPVKPGPVCQIEGC